MGIGLWRARRVEIDHVIDARDVQPTCCYIRGDQDVESPLSKAAHRTVSLDLGHISLKRDGAQAVLRELKRQSLRSMLGSSEDDGRTAIVCREQTIEQVSLATLWHWIERVFDSLCRSNRREFDDMRSVEHARCEFANGLGHRGRKQEVLSILGQSSQNPLDVGKESHVEHMVGFVQHQSLYRIEV